MNDLAEAKILVIRLSAIGDVMHTATAVHNLRLAAKNAHITWLVSPPADILLTRNPDIDRVLVWDRHPLDEAVAGGHYLTAIRILREARKIIGQEKYDIVLDVHGLFLTGLLAYFTGAKRRIGIRELHEGNSLFMTEMGPKADSPHKIMHYMTALSPLGIKGFTPGSLFCLKEDDRAWAKKFLTGEGVDPAHPMLMVNIRTTWPNKNWPPDYFAAALKDLPREVQILFCGSKEDTAAIERVQSNLSRSSLSIAGKTDLLQLAAVFGLANLLFTCDTGPLYIAEAVGLPTLSLWGPTHPDVYGPLTEGHTFILSENRCRFCGKTKCSLGTNACMNSIAPERAAEKLNEFFLKRDGT